jgi:hypothetical protein
VLCTPASNGASFWIRVRSPSLVLHVMVLWCYGVAVMVL